MKRVLLVMVVTLLVGCTRKSDLPNSNINIETSQVIEEVPLEVPVASEEKILYNLRNICQQSRLRGTEGAQKASLYLEKNLGEYGYSIDNQVLDTYRQDLKSWSKEDFFNLNPYNEEPQYQVNNIIATKKATEESKETLIVSAHYDTTEGTNGVIDNGSGVSVVLEVARILKDYPLPINVEFVFFGAEEYFLTGSRHYVSQLSKEQKENIIGCINVDMIGDSDVEDFILGTVDGTENALTIRLVEGLDSEYKLNTEGDIGVSDDWSFLKGQIPAILMSDQYINPIWIGKEAPLDSLDGARLKSAADILCQMIINLDTDYNIFPYEKEIIIEERELRDYFNAQSISKYPLSGYKLMNTKERLLSHGMGSEIVYMFGNELGDAYEITQQYDDLPVDRLIKGFEQIGERCWTKRDGESIHIILSNSIIVTHVIGELDQEQVKDLIDIITEVH